MRNLVWLSLFWIVGMATSPAAAQNAFFNPDFDVDAAGWESGWGGFGLDPLDEDADDCPGSSSGRLASTWFGTVHAGTAIAVDSCLEVEPFQEVWLDATLWLRNAGTVWVDLHVREFTDDVCTLHQSLLPREPFEPPVGATPEQYCFSLETREGVRSVNVVVDSVSISPYTLLLDRLYLGVRERLFADHFEGGSTCRWSSAIDGRAATDGARQ